MGTKMHGKLPDYSVPSQQQPLSNNSLTHSLTLNGLGAQLMEAKGKESLLKEEKVREG